MGVEKIGFLGVKIDNVSMKEALTTGEKFISSKKPHLICTPNIDHIMQARKDTSFQKIINSSSLCICDSLYVLWASRFLGNNLVEKVAGSDFLPLFAKVAAKKGYKIFLLGANSNVAKKAASNLLLKNSDLKIVGTLSPTSKELENESKNKKMIQLIKKSKPDALFVAFGAPKQEKWLYENLIELNVPLCMGVGGTFDFIAGYRKRAPKWIQRIGLEWFYRLVQEPRRLWKRYLIEDPQFIWFVLKEKMKQITI